MEVRSVSGDVFHFCFFKERLCVSISCVLFFQLHMVLPVPLAFILIWTTSAMCHCARGMLFTACTHTAWGLLSPTRP